MKTKFAPVVPIDMQYGLGDNGLMGDYHLLIAPQVLKRKEAYARYYRAEPVATIMDNGVIETDDPGNWEELREAANVVGADYVVLPDVPDDVEGTLKVSEENAKFLWQVFPLLGVVQGTDEKEVRNCIKALAKIEGVVGFAVPRSLVDHFGTRLKVVQYIEKNFQDMPIHLLGLSDNLEDDLYVANKSEQVIGLDSAIPIHMGYLIERTWSLGRPRRPSDYWLRRGVPKYAAENIRRIRGWLQGVNYVPTKPEVSFPPQETPEPKSPSSEKSEAETNEGQESLSRDLQESSSGTS